MTILPNSNKPDSILVFCPIGLGNFLMALPSLKKMREQCPLAQIDLLALKKGVQELADGSGLFNQIHFWDPDNEGLSKGFGLVLKLRKKRYSHSFSLFPTSHFKFVLFNWMVGARTRVGLRYRHTTLPSKVQHVSVDMTYPLHDVDQNLKLLAGFFNQSQLTAYSPMYLPIKPDTSLNPLRSPYYVCHPGSSLQRGMEGKRLPTQKWIEVLGFIYEEFGIKGVLIGGPEELSVRQEIESSVGDALLSIKTSSLNQAAGLVQQALFFVGNDSGLMHISVALQKKCIAFFGPSDESRTGPYPLTENSLKEHLVIRNRSNQNGSSNNNPRLKYEGDTSLLSLDVNGIKPLLKDFIQPLVLESNS